MDGEQDERKAPGARHRRRLSMQTPCNNAAKHNRRGGRQRPQPSISKLLPGQVTFRIVCHAWAVGGVIGSSGSMVAQLRRETSSRIHCEQEVRGSDHRVILISGSRSVEKRIRLSESEECDVSCAQEAMIRVFERLWEVEAERDGACAACGGVKEAYCALLVNTTQIGAVVGKGGKCVTRMRQVSGAKIRILTAPSCARKDDELIQITGRTLAVKKALVAVSRCLQDCPPVDRDPVPSSRLAAPVVAEKASYEAFPDPHAKFFPHLSSLLPPMSINSGSSASNACLPSMDVDGDPTLDKNGTWKGVVFRLLCSNVAAGAIIGKKGAIVTALRNQSGAAITVAASAVQSGERVVTISAFENLESWYSPAQNAVILVFARSIESDIEKGLTSGLGKGTSVTARLLVASDMVNCLNGNGSQVLSEIIEVTGANVRILEEDLVLDRVPWTVVVQITGEYKSVQDALFHVIGKLRDNLLPPDVLNEVRVRNPYGRVRETSPPGVHQQASLSLDTDPETFATQGIDWGLSNNMCCAHSSKLQLEQQTGGRGHTMPIPDYEQGVKAFGGNLELERSMDYLLPREVLNKVGGRSPCRGASDASSSSSHRSCSVSLDSDQENVLARGMDLLGVSDKSVQDALFHVIGKLRDNLLPPDVLNEVRVRNPYGRVRETSPPGVHQQASLSLDTDQETFATQGIDWGLSNNMCCAHSSKLQLEQQTGGRGHTMPIPDYEQGVKAFGGNLELERSMDYLLPREVLNKVGGRSPCRGASDASSSSSHRSFSVSLDSDQENVLARGMDLLGISDKISGPASQILQPQQAVGRKKASAYGRRGGELESGKKYAIVKNTTVDILVPGDVFGSVYGKDGCNLAHLRQISGAKVEVHDPSPGGSGGTVVISGTPEQTLAAQSLLQAFILSYQ